MEVFNLVLDRINIVLTTIIGIAFASQLIYTILFFVPAKKYKKADKKHKVGVIICARNEEKVIKDTIECIKKQNYPSDMFDILVVAHNCTDRTAELARQAGANIVLECNDDNPEHKRVAYALKYVFDYILENKLQYDFYVRFDADNLVHPDYLDKMNDAFASGVKVARGFNNAKNLTDNVVAGVSGLWYIRDCRFTCQGRSFLRTHQMLAGPGMMFAHEVIAAQGGWTQMGLIEDAEFAMDCMFRGYKSEYVKEAMCYDDQPTTIKECYKRNTRMGSGLHKLFYTHGIKSFFMFFAKWKWCYLDMFLTLLFMPIAVLCCIWLPLYYGYALIYNSVVGNWELFYQMLKMIGISLSCAFVLPFILQAVLVYFLEKKRINQPFWKVFPAMLAFPLFMIIYAVGIFIGSVTKPKWQQIARSKSVSMEEFEPLKLQGSEVGYISSSGDEILSNEDIENFKKRISKENNHPKTETKEK